MQSGRLGATAVTLLLVVGLMFPRRSWAEPSVAQLWKARALEAIDRLQKDKSKTPVGYEAMVEFAYAAHVGGGSLRKEYEGGESYHLLFKSDLGEVLDVAFAYAAGAPLPNMLLVYRLPKGWVAASNAQANQVTVGTEDALLTFDLREPFRVIVSKNEAAARASAKGRKCMEGDRAACWGLRSSMLLRQLANRADQRVALKFMRSECDKSGGDACASLGAALNQAGDADSSYLAFYRACAADIGAACGVIALLMEQEGASAVACRAMREKACRLDASGCNSKRDGGIADGDK